MLRLTLFSPLLGFLALLSSLAAAETAPEEATIQASRLTIAFEPGADGLENRIAGLLRDRIQRRSTITIALSPAKTVETNLRIALGRNNEDSPRITTMMKTHGITLPGVARTAPESFALKMVEEDSAPLLVAVGADSRGLLYAAGEILRRIEHGADSIRMATIDMATAPAYRFRSSSANQGGTQVGVIGRKVMTP